MFKYDLFSLFHQIVASRVRFGQTHIIYCGEDIVKFETFGPENMIFYGPIWDYCSLTPSSINKFWTDFILSALKFESDHLFNHLYACC